MREQRDKVVGFGILILIIGAIAWYFGASRSDEIYRRLQAIEGVTKVEKVEMDKRYESCLKDKYLVTFTQPVDWDNPEAGTFSQRVEIGITDRADVNFLETEGYSLKADLIETNYVSELVNMYRGNYIHVEHRFFGASSPDNLSYDETGFWEYLTLENAARDYHNIYTKLAPLLGDKWVGYGYSFGGLMTNAYAQYFPEDMNVYVPFVAPCADSLSDKRFYEFVYTKVGDAAFGAKEGERLRNLVTQFQVELMKHKEELLPSYIEAIDKTGMRFRFSARPEVLYDLNVLEFATMVWQYNQPFDEIERILAMPDDTEEAGKSKLDAEFELLISLQSPMDWSPDMYAWPYYVAAAQEVGNYYYDFSYLRNALKREGALGALTVTEDMEENLLWDTVFTEEQKSAFTYDSKAHDELVAALKVTEAKMVMIFGATDPWISVRIPDPGNENIKTYVHPTLPHVVNIADFGEDTQKEIRDYIDGCLARK